MVDHGHSAVSRDEESLGILSMLESDSGGVFCVCMHEIRAFFDRITSSYFK